MSTTKNVSSPDDVRIVCTKCMRDADKFEVRRTATPSLNPPMFGVRCHGVERLVAFRGMYQAVDADDPVVLWSQLADVYEDPYAEMERFERQMVECAEMVELLRRIAPHYPPKTPAPEPAPAPNSRTSTNWIFPVGGTVTVYGAGAQACPQCHIVAGHAIGCPLRDTPF